MKAVISNLNDLPLAELEPAIAAEYRGMPAFSLSINACVLNGVLYALGSALQRGAGAAIIEPMMASTRLSLAVLQAVATERDVSLPDVSVAAPTVAGHKH